MAPATREAAAAARAAVDSGRSVALLVSAVALREQALKIMAEARAAGALKIALAGVREAARCTELMAKLSGALRPDAANPTDPESNSIPTCIQIEFVEPGTHTRGAPQIEGAAE